MVSASTATSKINEAGSSHEICPPIALLNMRVMPVGPHRPAAFGPPPPPTLPDSFPVRRPKPLYPKSTFQKLLFCEPPMYGRLAAGVSITAATHQPADTR